MHINTLADLKSKIIELKISHADDNALRQLLGALVNVVCMVKEALVMEKMNEMRLLAKTEIETRDDSVLAKVVEDDGEIN